MGQDAFLELEKTKRPVSSTPQVEVVGDLIGNSAMVIPLGADACAPRRVDARRGGVFGGFCQMVSADVCYFGIGMDWILSKFPYF